MVGASLPFRHKAIGSLRLPLDPRWEQEKRDRVPDGFFATIRGRGASYESRKSYPQVIHMNPDGNRGSFFPATQKRYRSPDQLKTASDHLQYARAMVDEAVDHEADVSRGTICETSQDHDYIESHAFLHSMICTKCGIVVEHPHKWYLEREP